MLIVGIGPLGCIPSQLSMNNSTDGECIKRVNDIVMAFNSRFFPMLPSLNSSFPGAFFVYQNIYDRFINLIQNPSDYGKCLRQELEALLKNISQALTFVNDWKLVLSCVLMFDFFNYLSRLYSEKSSLLW